MKTLMILLMMLAFLNQPTGAQGMPVYDNTNFLTLGKSLIESAKQTSQLLKTVRFLKEQKERLEQVSGVIRQLQAVQEIVDNNQRLIRSVGGDLQEILNSPHIREDEIEDISESFQSIMEMAREDLNFLQQLLTSSVLNMTDSERLVILEAQQERSREWMAEVALRKRRYQTIISFREIKSRINSREIGY